MKTILTLGEFVENYGEGKTFDFEDAGGIDVWDDYDERCGCAFCGVALTDAGRKRYAHALSLPCSIVASGGTVSLLVHAENAREAEAVAEFINAAAGALVAVGLTGRLKLLHRGPHRPRCGSLRSAGARGSFQREFRAWRGGRSPCRPGWCVRA